jgi:nucleolar pre-ribosomal-associated protein 1
MHLTNLEHTINFSNFQMLSSPTLPRPPFQPPHRSHRLHTPLPKSNAQDTLWLWGWSVEYLWRASMTGGHRAPEGWGALTRRLLIWRAMVGEEGSEVGEWARREVVGCVTD